jgi:hypothetical protein
MKSSGQHLVNNFTFNNIYMKKSKMYLKLLPTILLFMSIIFNGFAAPQEKQEYYEVKIYRIKDSGQEATMDSYLKNAYLPALHRAGIKTVGVFKPIEADTAFGKLVYVFIPFKTLEQYSQLSDKLSNDKVYSQAGKAFLDAPFDNPPYVRYESILAKAFTHMPQFKIPTFSTPNSERIYEFRSYESATEAKAATKIKMFNEGGEIGIFVSIGSNPVFYGQVLLGSQMPRLIYMTSYADMKSHDEHWVTFKNHPDWIKLKATEEYNNATSKTRAYLLHPTSYSDF